VTQLRRMMLEELERRNYSEGTIAGIRCRREAVDVIAPNKSADPWRLTGTNRRSTST
jgi:hypothetical protein